MLRPEHGSRQHRRPTTSPSATTTTSGCRRSSSARSRCSRTDRTRWLAIASSRCSRTRDPTSTGTASAYDVHQLLRGERFSLFPTMLIRRSEIDACGWFSSDFPTAEDVDMTYRLARRGPVLFCDEVLFRYRRHSGNVTNNLRESSLASLMALEVQRYRQSVVADRTGAMDARRGKRALGRYWAKNDLRGAASLWRSGRRREAIDLASWTLRTFPRETVSVLATRAARPSSAARPGAATSGPDRSGRFENDERSRGLGRLRYRRTVGRIGTREWDR